MAVAAAASSSSAALSAVATGSGGTRIGTLRTLPAALCSNGSLSVGLLPLPLPLPLAVDSKSIASAKLTFSKPKSIDRLKGLGLAKRKSKRRSAEPAKNPKRFGFRSTAVDTLGLGRVSTLTLALRFNTECTPDCSSEASSANALRSPTTRATLSRRFAIRTAPGMCTDAASRIQKS